LIFDKGDTVLFTGDSITDCGRRRPLGEKDGLGNGYVNFLCGMLYAGYPDRVLRVLNTGISGNRITDLDSRWQWDVIDLKPDWLSVFIGINDVFFRFNRPDLSPQVTPDIYHDTYSRLIGSVKGSLKGLILATPYILETDKQDPIRARMDECGKAVKDLAEKNGAILVDVQQAFDDFMEQRPDFSLAADRVHPNPTGHFIIARAFLQAFGYNWKG